MKKWYAAALAAMFTLVFASSAYAAAPTLGKDPKFQVHNGTQTVHAGKMSYTVVMSGGKVTSITPVATGHGMAGSKMSTKAVSFKQAHKNAICYYWWCDVYGRCWYVWHYC